jgi:hypothetical protein
MARFAIWTLGIIVLALAGSWAWTRFAPKAPVQAPGHAARAVRVQVLNGSGEGGVGSRMATLLREGGFQVVEVRNADRQDYFATLVVARQEDPSSARAVARYLGSPPVILQAHAGDMADVTVVIGSDRSKVRVAP